jgi:glycosyltransferase involved in cell wall biosynthesis
MNSVPVTIMIPTFNQASYLVEAVESSLMQDYENLQVVVADDCSNDTTMKIARRFENDTRFVYVRNKENMGRVRNYSNTLFKHVKGEWVVNLDGDDYYTDKHFVSDAVKKIMIAKNLGYNVVAYLANHDLDRVRKWIPDSLSLDKWTLCCSGKRYFQEYPHAGQFAHMSCLYHVATAKSLGGYVLDSVAADFHALMRVFIQGELIISTKKTGIWRVHDQNASTHNLRQKYLNASAMYDDLAVFARPYFSEQELELWKVAMMSGAYDDYILTSCALASPSELLVLVRELRFRKVFVYAAVILVKRILRNLGVIHK